MSQLIVIQEEDKLQSLPPGDIITTAVLENICFFYLNESKGETSTTTPRVHFTNKHPITELGIILNMLQYDTLNKSAAFKSEFTDIVIATAAEAHGYCSI